MIVMQIIDSLDEAIEFATNLQFPYNDEEEINWSNLESPGVIYPTDNSVVYLIRPFDLWPDVVLHKEATRDVNAGKSIESLLAVYGEDKINRLLNQPPKDIPVDLNQLIEFCESRSIKYRTGQYLKKGGDWKYVIVHENSPDFFKETYPQLNKIFNRCLAPLSRTQ